MRDDAAPNLLARIEVLEQRRIGVADLPLAALQRKLETDWLPNPEVLFGQAVARGDTGTLTFTASTTSDTLTVAHGLDHVPAAVVATAAEGAIVCHTDPTTWTAASFDIIGEAGSSITDLIQFSWVAL